MGIKASLVNVIKKNQFYIRLKRSDRFWTLLTGTFWMVLGMGISRVLMLLAMIIVARILGSEKYGEFGMIRTTINTFTVFAAFGIGLTANKFVAEFKNKDAEKTSRIMGLTLIFSLCLGLIISILIFAFAGHLASSALKSDDMAQYISISAIMIVLSALNGAYSGIFSGLEAFKKTAQLNIITGLLGLIIVVSGAYFWGLLGTVIAFGIYLFAITIFSHIYLLCELKMQSIKITYNNEIFKEWKILVMFSLPLALAGIVATPTHWISNAMVFRLPDGKVAIGIFTACLSIQTIIYFLGNNLNAPLLSLMSREKMDLKMEKVNILSSWLIGIFVSLPFLIFPEIAEFMFGESFAGPEFRITLIFILLSSIIVMYKQGLSRVFMVNNKIWIAFYSNLLWSIVLIIAIYFLRIYGSIGLGLSFFIAYVVNLFLIIPYLLHQKLIMKNSLLSRPAITLWCCILFISSLHFFDIKFGLRTIISSLILLIMLFTVRKILKMNFGN